MREKTRERESFQETKPLKNAVFSRVSENIN